MTSFWLGRPAMDGFASGQISMQNFDAIYLNRRTKQCSELEPAVLVRKQIDHQWRLAPVAACGVRHEPAERNIMTNGILAVFGMSGGELLIVLVALAIGGVLLVGGATAVAYFVVRMLSRRSGSGPHDGITSGGK